MADLRDEIAAILKGQLEDGYYLPSEADRIATRLADRILALPEIAEALKLTVVKQLDLTSGNRS